MKKQIIILFLLLPCSLTISAQTKEIESEIITQLLLKAQKAEQTQQVSELRSKLNVWSKQLKETPYPVLPYDSASNSFIWKKVLRFDGMTKKEIMTRIKEWSAMNFKRYAATLDYLDEENGKMIVKGYFPITIVSKINLLFFKQDVIITQNVSANYAFTVKDGALKIEVFNSELETQSTNTYYKNIANIFPIFDKPTDSWEGFFSALNQINDGYTGTFKSIDGYVKTYKSDYGF